MLRSVFLEDVARFYKIELLPFVCLMLATRPLIWISYAGIAVLFLLFAHGPRDHALLVFFAVFLTCCYVAHYTVHILTPLWFGEFFYGRLTNKYTGVVANVIQFGASFLAVPWAQEIDIQSMEVPTGTVGRTYVLLRHPAEPRIILPLIDDDPRFMHHLMGFVGRDREAEIKAEVDKVRPSASDQATR